MNHSLLAVSDPTRAFIPSLTTSASLNTSDGCSDLVTTCTTSSTADSGSFGFKRRTASAKRPFKTTARKSSRSAATPSGAITAPWT